MRYAKNKIDCKEDNAYGKQHKQINRFNSDPCEIELNKYTIESKNDKNYEFSIKNDLIPF